MSITLTVCEPTVVRRMPRYEGSNICTWIGFKHVMYLVEEAVLEHLRQNGMAPRELYEQNGICVDIVDSSVRILHALHMDDRVRVEVTPKPRSADADLAFAVQMFVDRDNAEVKCLTGSVKVALPTEPGEATDPGATPRCFTGLVPVSAGQDVATARSPRPAGGRGGAETEEELIRRLVPDGANAFVWRWRVPYFYCHFTERLQHSGYLRLLEEVVDLFLADRGISIRTMLQTRQWIPVVPNARVQILADALMEETIYTVFTVEDIYKDVTYTARMDCYVNRYGTLVHTATGRITHGYAEILNRRDWKLVNFDDETLAALRGARP